MNLPLFSSTSDFTAPNLVGLQHPELAALPTQLICPMRSNLSPTPLRAIVRFGNEEYVVACDLIRPINTRALKRLGELDRESSLRVMQTFLLLLASDED